MFGTETVDVLVVGAGPVGLMGALLLARRGLKVRIVDEAWRAGTQSYALALHPATMRLFAELGLEAAVRRCGRALDTLAFYERDRRLAEIRLDGPMWVVRQDVLENLLAQRLREAGVRVAWQHRLAGLLPGDDHVLATVDELVKESTGYALATTEWVVATTRRVRARLLLGADGYASRIRRALDIPFERVGPPEFFAVFEFNTVQDLGHEARVVFDEATTSVLWPMPGARCRWSFGLRDVDFPEESRVKDRIALRIGANFYPALGPSDLERLLAARAPWFAQHVGELTWAIAVRFEHRLARQFGRGRCWLAGDAAHLTGPVGMQSLNVGFTEVAALADDYEAVLKHGAPLQVLDRYAEAARQNWEMLQGLHGVMGATEHTPAGLASYGPRMWECLPGSAGEIGALAAQLHLDLPGTAMAQA